MNSDHETPGDTAWRLILADDPAEIARLEADYGRSQADTANFMIEETCWSTELPELRGGKGTPRERLEALRAAYRQQEQEEEDAARRRA